MADKKTTFSAVVAPKNSPLIVTELPTTPESGEIEVIFGVAT